MSDSRQSSSVVPPAQSGSPGMTPAVDHRVSTSPPRTRPTAASIARSTLHNGPGINSAARSLRHTVRLRSPSANGRAMLLLTGVT